ncbi:hypothetical protein L9F63_019245, partial [Diploptera punctata]
KLMHHLFFCGAQEEKYQPLQIINSGREILSQYFEYSFFRKETVNSITRDQLIRLKSKKRIYVCVPQIISLYQIPLLRVYRKHDRSLQGPTSWIKQQ